MSTFRYFVICTVAGPEDEINDLSTLRFFTNQTEAVAYMKKMEEDEESYYDYQGNVFALNESNCVDFSNEVPLVPAVCAVGLEAVDAYSLNKHGTPDMNSLRLFSSVGAAKTYAQTMMLMQSRKRKSGGGRGDDDDDDDIHPRFRNVRILPVMEDGTVNFDDDEIVAKKRKRTSKHTFSCSAAKKAK